MISGLSIEQLAKQVVEDTARKRDFYVPTRELAFAVEDKKPVVRFDIGDKNYRAAMSDHAFRQICEFSGIPAKYVDRIREKGLDDLLEQNVRRWLMELAEKRFLRAYGSNGSTDLTLRAFLSDKYRALDYLDLLEAIMPVVRESGLSAITSKVTETRLYLQLSTPHIKGIVEQAGPGGHTIVRELSPLIVVSTSEVGMGALNVEWGVYDGFCTNGAIFGTAIRKIHLGRGGSGDDASEFFSDETRKLSDAALWAQVQDVVRAACDEVRFRETVAKIGDLQHVALTDTSKAIEAVGERYNMTEDEQQKVLDHLVGSGDGANMFGLFNAVTRTAQDLENYDRAVELERVGGALASLNTDAVRKWLN